MTVPLVHLRDVNRRPSIFTIWEKHRNSKQIHWAIECFAEALGAFLYTYIGMGSQVGWIFQNIANQPGLSSIFQIGMAYACGIFLAISVCAGTSGGHFNPCISIVMALFKGFPKRKAARYIVAQILGAYIAGLCVYAQWKEFIVLAEGGLVKAGAFETVMFTPNGPAGAFANYLTPGQTLARVFMNEFVNCFVVAIVIWACIDPSNGFVPPSMGIVIIAFAYGAVIWGSGVPGVSLNAARDIGGRLAAMTIWGMQAKGTSYAAISALVNIPATIFSVMVYEIFLTDSDRVIDAAHLEYGRVHANHLRLGHSAIGATHVKNGSNSVGDLSSGEKSHVEMYEHASNNGAHA